MPFLSEFYAVTGDIDGVNTLRPKQDGRHYADDFFSKDFFVMNILRLFCFGHKLLSLGGRVHEAFY